MQTEIKRLKAERDAAIKEVAKWSREAGASQAREAKLREALETVKVDLIDGRLFAAVVDTKSWHPRVLNAIALPTDDTALKEAIKQGQRAALLEAADVLDTFASKRCGHSDEIRRMVDEIK
jgi:hypothetical protein